MVSLRGRWRFSDLERGLIRPGLATIMVRCPAAKKSGASLDSPYRAANNIHNYDALNSACGRGAELGLGLISWGMSCRVLANMALMVRAAPDGSGPGRRPGRRLRPQAFWPGGRVDRGARERPVAWRVCGQALCPGFRRASRRSERSQEDRTRARTNRLPRCGMSHVLPGRDGPAATPGPSRYPGPLPWACARGAGHVRQAAGICRHG
jgi:hypothetical protein